jgi:hypothetical protein
MHTELFCVCRSATTHEDGSMDVRGIHDRRQFASPPSEGDTVTLAIRLRFDEDEHSKYQMQVILFDPEGKKLGGFPLQEIGPKEGQNPSYACALFDFPAAYFAQSGTFRLNLHVNGLVLTTRFLHIECLEA